MQQQPTSDPSSDRAIRVRDLTTDREGTEVVLVFIADTDADTVTVQTEEPEPKALVTVTWTGDVHYNVHLDGPHLARFGKTVPAYLLGGCVTLRNALKVLTLT
jgi:hypothetical protein